MAMASGCLPWNEGFSYWAPVGTGWWWHPLDLPLSFAADIVMLPYTILAQLIEGNFEANNPKMRFLIAGATDDIVLARELIEQHPEFAHVRYRDTPLLFVAAATRRPKFVALLLEHGAEVRATDENGKTALHHAVYPTYVVRYLPMYGGERKALQKQARYVDVVRLLMKHGAEPHDPLRKAARVGELDFVRVMVENGVDVNARSDGGDTPLHNAAYGGQLPGF